MGKRIRISAGEVTVQAELNDSSTAAAVAEALPIQAPANRWGQEVYFAIPVDADPAPDARTEMRVGELAYWPPGRAFCIFFGATPASRGSEPRAASAVNPIGQVLEDASRLSEVADGSIVSITAER